MPNTVHAIYILHRIGLTHCAYCNSHALPAINIHLTYTCTADNKHVNTGSSHTQCAVRFRTLHPHPHPHPQHTHTYNTHNSQQTNAGRQAAQPPGLPWPSSLPPSWPPPPPPCVAPSPPPASVSPIPLCPRPCPVPPLSAHARGRACDAAGDLQRCLRVRAASGDAGIPVHSFIHTYIYIHTYTHTYTYIHTHTHTRTNTHRQTHTHSHTHMRGRAQDIQGIGQDLG